MSDAQLRELRRTWERTRSVEDEAQWLRARLRAGELHPARLALAVHAGHQAAQQAFPFRSLPRIKLAIIPALQPHQELAAMFPKGWMGSLMDEIGLGPAPTGGGWPPEAEGTLRWAADLIDLARAVEGAEGIGRFSSADVCELIATALAVSLVGPVLPSEGLDRAREALETRALAMGGEDDIEDLEREHAEGIALIAVGGESLAHLLLATGVVEQSPGLSLALDRVERAVWLDLGLAFLPLATAVLARVARFGAGPHACLRAVWQVASVRGAAAVRATAREALVPWLLHGREEGSQASPYDS